jgi:hypothetical protein
MKRLLLLIPLALLSGCSTLSVENITPEGRRFTAHAYSFLWDRNLEGLQFNYERGTLEVINLKSTPDKETIARGFETLKAGFNMLEAGLK